MYKREKKTLMFVLQTLFVICSYLFFVCAFIPALAKGRLFEILKNCCNMRKFLMADKIFRAVASFLYFLWQLLFCSLSFTHVYFRFCFVFSSTWGICSIWFHFRISYPYNVAFTFARTPLFLQANNTNTNMKYGISMVWKCQCNNTYPNLVHLIRTIQSPKLSNAGQYLDG